MIDQAQPPTRAPGCLLQPASSQPRRLSLPSRSQSLQRDARTRHDDDLWIVSDAVVGADGSIATVESGERVVAGTGKSDADA